MVKIDHAYMGDGFNIHHLEGSIWTHTMMVMKEAQHKSTVIRLAALCHDVGKIAVHVDIEKTKRRRFSNHEAVSVFYAKKILRDFEITKEDEDRILSIVAQHGSLYNFFEDGRIPKDKHMAVAEKFTSTQFADISTFYRCDHEGRFYSEESKNDIKIYEDFSAILDIIQIKEHVREAQDQKRNEPKLLILVGPPRAGKSTFVKERVFPAQTVFVSRDTAMLKYAKDNNISGNYSVIFSRLSEVQHKEIDAIVYKTFTEAVKAQVSIVIDQTNMSKKSRRKWLSDSRLKEYNKEAFVFIESLDVLLSRNTQEKFIGRDVIKHMMKRFVFPQYDEFNKIVLV